MVVINGWRFTMKRLTILMLGLSTMLLSIALHSMESNPIIKNMESGNTLWGRVAFSLRDLPAGR